MLAFKAINLLMAVAVGTERLVTVLWERWRWSYVGMTGSRFVGLLGVYSCACVIDNCFVGLLDVYSCAEVM
jgi:hypothetical protein